MRLFLLTPFCFCFRYFDSEQCYANHKITGVCDKSYRCKTCCRFVKRHKPTDEEPDDPHEATCGLMKQVYVFIVGVLKPSRACALLDFCFKGGAVSGAGFARRWSTRSTCVSCKTQIWTECTRREGNSVKSYTTSRLTPKRPNAARLPARMPGGGMPPTWGSWCLICSWPCADARIAAPFLTSRTSIATLADKDSGTGFFERLKISNAKPVKKQLF